jgi:hypothetical protein
VRERVVKSSKTALPSGTLAHTQTLSFEMREKKVSSLCVSIILRQSWRNPSSLILLRFNLFTSTERGNEWRRRHIKREIRHISYRILRNLCNYHRYKFIFCSLSLSLVLHSTPLSFSLDKAHQKGSSSSSSSGISSGKIGIANEIEILANERKIHFWCVAKYHFLFLRHKLLFVIALSRSFSSSNVFVVIKSTKKQLKFSIFFLSSR